LLDQFSNEKQELIEAMQSSNISKQDIQGLVNLLNQSDLETLSKSVELSGSIPVQEKEPQEKESDYSSIEPDRELIKEFEQDISFVLEDLGSENSETRAKAAAFLATQPPAVLAESGLKMITSELPYKIRRLMAGVIKRAGAEAEKEFLKKIHVGMSSSSLNKIIRISDIFAGNPGLVPLLREIALNGPLDVIPAVVSILQPMPGEEVDSLLLDIFERSIGKVKWDIIPLFAERKILDAAPRLLEFIKPVKIWEKEQELAVQQDICRTLGVLHSPEAAEALIKAAKASMISLLYKPKPDSIRAIATWALTQLPQDSQTDKALAKLKKDRSPLVKKAVKLSEIIKK
jgi:hypothetical protein